MKKKLLLILLLIPTISVAQILNGYKYVIIPVIANENGFDEIIIPGRDLQNTASFFKEAGFNVIKKSNSYPEFENNSKNSCEVLKLEIDAKMGFWLDIEFNFSNCKNEKVYSKAVKLADWGEGPGMLRGLSRANKKILKPLLKKYKFDNSETPINNSRACWFCPDEYSINKRDQKSFMTDNTPSKNIKIKDPTIVEKVSKVDINIPINKKTQHRYALVIGNEDYQSRQRTLNSEQNVDYAVNDANVFREYALNTLGVEEDNMFFLTNATAVEMGQQIDLVVKIMSKLGNKGELIVYYAGHGFPDEKTNIPYLIPVDVSASSLSYAIKLDDFYQKLSAANSKQITIFLDACFTGGGRSSGLIASRGVKIKPKGGTLNGNIVVFSASSGDQSALPYHKENHGMFTYHLLKKLQESKGDIEMGELADYLKDEVSIKSLKVNQKEQDPTVNTSKGVLDVWKNWKF